MSERRLDTTLWLPVPREEAFEFFGRAENLERITPPWLRFQITSDLPIDMRAGAEIRYSLRLHGIPIRWRTEITNWEPAERFVDEQRQGPYRLWQHEHTFSDERGGTRIDDTVRYAFTAGPIEPLVHRWFVAPDLERIFAFRHQAVARELLGARASEAEIGEVRLSRPARGSAA